MQTKGAPFCNGRQSEWGFTGFFHPYKWSNDGPLLIAFPVGAHQVKKKGAWKLMTWGWALLFLEVGETQNFG